MLAETFAWWLVLEAVGLIALPIALVLFQRLPGAGIAFAKPLGLLVGGYLFWLALTAHLLPNRPGSVVWVFALLAAVDFLLLRRSWRETLALLESKSGLILAVEVVFTLVFFVGSHIRSYIPEIAATEKPMDFMLLNAVDRSRYYPPEDPWLAGFDVSYYYFGYLIQAMVGNLAAVKTSVAFNLGLTSTAALAATAAFGLGHDMASLMRKVSFRSAVGVGVAAAIFVTLLGNLEGALEFGRANGVLPESAVERVDIANLDEARESDACLIPVACIKYPNEESSFWWWWRATRISPGTRSITEFPFFSFILGDLHPHVMAIPYLLTSFALALALWRSEAPVSFDTWRGRPLLLLLCAVLVGGLGFLNSWDLPTGGFLIALMAFLRNLAGRDLRVALTDSVGFLAPLGGLAVLLYMPFYLGFSNQAEGLKAVTDGATRPLHGFLYWAPLLAVALPLPIARLWSDAAARTGRRLRLVSLLPLTLLVLWMLLIAANGGSPGQAISARGWNWFSTLFFASALVACILALWRSAESADEDERVLTAPLAAMTVALLLIFGVELFFISDVFGTRINSVFKLYYQSWLLLGVSGGFSAWWLIARWRLATPALRLPKEAVLGAIGLCLAAAFLYPIGATLSRTEGLGRDGRTLDGTLFTRAEDVNEYLAIDWLRQRAQPGDRLIEAGGDSYSEGAMVSARSGVPTILGWPGHERQWGRDGVLLAQRREDIASVYSTPSLEEALAILRKYGVTYVFVGSSYRAAFPVAGIDKFETGLPAVFESGDVAIYRVPRLEPETGP